MQNGKNQNKVPAERLREVRKDHNLSQEEFAEKLGYTPAYISMLERGDKDPSDKTARRIVEHFPEINKAWLLDESDCKTVNDLSQQFVERLGDLNNACFVMLEASLREVCARENMPVPTLSDIPELLLLQAQLRDYSDSLMWNYVKWKDASHVWSLIAQAEDAKKRRENNG